jgi:hypothetical protein
LRGTTIIPTKEFLLNLHRDLMQPSLGSIRPLRVLADLCPGVFLGRLSSH